MLEGIVVPIGGLDDLEEPCGLGDRARILGRIVGRWDAGEGVLAGLLRPLESSI